MSMRERVESLLELLPDSPRKPWSLELSRHKRVERPEKKRGILPV